jgi:tRNA threonylcarbamoyladenosine biosynthesis protein TsaB
MCFRCRIEKTYLKMDSPLILAFDTSAAYCAAALLSGDTVITQTFEPMKKGQAERLMFLLQEMLDLQSLSYTDLSAIGVGIGPGNFTGIRIGVSAARGLALGLGIPAYGVDGFDQRAILNSALSVQSIPGPRDQRYVRDADDASLLDVQAFEAKGYLIQPDPAPDALAASIALVARSRFPNPSAAPAPYYLKAPDAAPSKIISPTILP